MAREQGKTEDTVKEIINTGVDFRPRTIRSREAGKHVIKPYNFDGEYLVDDNNLPANPTESDHITVSLIHGESTSFNHHLDRVPQQVRVENATACACVHLLTADKATATIWTNISHQKADGDWIHAAIAGTGAEQTITTGITQPDVPRNISITTTNNSSPSGNVTIAGLDVAGASQTENITITAGGTANGTSSFLSVTSITIPAGVTAADTVTIGIGDTLAALRAKIIIY